MSDKNIIKPEYVKVSEVWTFEDRNFTPWLKDNIDFLNDALGFQIEIEQREVKQQENFSADLLGKDENGNRVIIENQYNETDHKHLGQILVYCINLEAKIGIWICEEARKSHIEVFEWLNENCPEDMGFYLIQLKVAKVEDFYLPTFEIIVKPSDESTLIGNMKKELTETEEIYFNFWRQFVEYSSLKTSLFSHRRPTKAQWFDVFVFGIRGVSITNNFTKTELRSEIYIDTLDKSRNKNIFMELKKFKNEIEPRLSDIISRYNAELKWDKLDDKRASRVQLIKNDINCYDQKVWTEAHEFLTESTIMLHEVFKEYFEKINL